MIKNNFANSGDIEQSIPSNLSNVLIKKLITPTRDNFPMPTGMNNDINRRWERTQFQI